MYQNNPIRERKITLSKAIKISLSIAIDTMRKDINTKELKIDKAISQNNPESLTVEQIKELTSEIAVIEKRIAEVEECLNDGSVKGIQGATIDPHIDTNIKIDGYSNYNK